MNKYIDSEWSVTLISHIGNALINNMERSPLRPLQLSPLQLRPLV